MSAEIVVNKRLDAIEKVILLSPSRIRFKYNKRTDTYDAYQIKDDDAYFNFAGAKAISSANICIPILRYVGCLRTRMARLPSYLSCRW